MFPLYNNTETSIVPKPLDPILESESMLRTRFIAFEASTLPFSKKLNFYCPQTSCLVKAPTNIFNNVQRMLF